MRMSYHPVTPNQYYPSAPQARNANPCARPITPTMHHRYLPYLQKHFDFDHSNLSTTFHQQQHAWYDYKPNWIQKDYSWKHANEVKYDEYCPQQALYQRSNKCYSPLHNEQCFSPIVEKEFLLGGDPNNETIDVSPSPLAIEYMENSILNSKSSPDASPPSSDGSLRRLDIVCGRGAPINFHYGNQAFRELVEEHQTSYLCAKRSDKPRIALKVMDLVKAGDARFVRRHKASKKWVEIDDNCAYEKVCQALRDGAPNVRRQMLASSAICESRREQHREKENKSK